MKNNNKLNFKKSIWENEPKKNPKKKLIKELIKLSTDKNMKEIDFINQFNDEWEFENLYIKEELEGKCICGRKIKNIYVIKNKDNNKTATLGSTCIADFGYKEIDDIAKKIDEIRNYSIKNNEKDKDLENWKELFNKKLLLYLWINGFIQSYKDKTARKQFDFLVEMKYMKRKENPTEKQNVKIWCMIFGKKGIFEKLKEKGYCITKDQFQKYFNQLQRDDIDEKWKYVINFFIANEEGVIEEFVNQIYTKQIESLILKDGKIKIDKNDIKDGEKLLSNWLFFVIKEKIGIRKNLNISSELKDGMDALLKIEINDFKNDMHKYNFKWQNLEDDKFNKLKELIKIILKKYNFCED
ncbi:MAG: hypothetical protein ACRCW6_03090 [Mycoplasmoidaceae bacterium]